MAKLTAAELAARSGSTEARVLRLVEIGVVPQRDPDAFEPEDVQRVRLAEVLDAAGIPFDALGEAIARGALSFDFLKYALPMAPELDPTTYRQQAERLGLSPETLLNLYPAWGLPRPNPDDLVRRDEADTFDEFAKFIPMGAIEETTLRRAAAVTGDSARRIGNWGLDFFREFIAAPIRRGGGSPQQVLDAGAAMAAVSGDSLERQFIWLLRRTLEHNTIQYAVEMVEEAIEEAGITVPRPSHPPAIAFLDLTGFTTLTEELGDEAAADRSMVLVRVVQEPVPRHGGGLVKVLGDGVLLHFPQPIQAVTCGLELVDRVTEAGLPPARVGITAGPVVWRDGDCFGRTVNVASRILQVARPGEVLVTGEVVEASTGVSVDFEDVGPAALKGVANPVWLFRAITAANGGPSAPDA